MHADARPIAFAKHTNLVAWAQCGLEATGKIHVGDVDLELLIGREVLAAKRDENLPQLVEHAFPRPDSETDVAGIDELPRLHDADERIRCDGGVWLVRGSFCRGGPWR